VIPGTIKPCLPAYPDVYEVIRRSPITSVPLSTTRVAVKVSIEQLREILNGIIMRNFSANIRKNPGVNLVRAYTNEKILLAEKSCALQRYLFTCTLCVQYMYNFLHICSSTLQQKSLLCIPFLEIARGLSPNFHIHVSVSDLYIPRIGPHISCSRTCRSIVEIYKSLTDT
jgi:hypothetical protein